MPGDLVLPFRIAAAALPPYLSASGGQLFIALRATAESLRCAAFTCVALAPCSFAWRKGVRSHPLRGAYRACCAGLKRPFSYMVGVLGFEPRTSSLSGTRSNQLSYTPSPQKVACLSATGLRPPLRGTATFRGPRSPAFRAASPYSCLRVWNLSSGTYAQAHFDLIEFSNSLAETSAR